MDYYYIVSVMYYTLVDKPDSVLYVYIDVWRCWENGKTCWDDDWISGAYNLESLLEVNFSINHYCESSFTIMSER